MIIRLKTFVKNSFNTLTQRGDTLVEVLICVLIVSVILTGAYVTTSKSSLGVRNSQEHAEALKLVESQLEQIRQNASKTSGSNVFTIASTPATFCMVNGVAEGTGFAPGTADCVQNSAAQPSTPESRYKLTVTRSDIACVTINPNCRLFVVTATWDNVTGSGTASEQIAYRLYK